MNYEHRWLLSQVTLTIAVIGMCWFGYWLDLLHMWCIITIVNCVRLDKFSRL
jgi:hypothetical protein